MRLYGLFTNHIELYLKLISDKVNKIKIKAVANQSTIYPKNVNASFF